MTAAAETRSGCDGQSGEHGHAHLQRLQQRYKATEESMRFFEVHMRKNAVLLHTVQSTPNVAKSLQRLQGTYRNRDSKIELLGKGLFDSTFLKHEAVYEPGHSAPTYPPLEIRFTPATHYFYTEEFVDANGDYFYTKSPNTLLVAQALLLGRNKKAISCGWASKINAYFVLADRRQLVVRCAEFTSVHRHAQRCSSPNRDSAGTKRARSTEGGAYYTVTRRPPRPYIPSVGMSTDSDYETESDDSAEEHQSVLYNDDEGELQTIALSPTSTMVHRVKRYNKDHDLYQELVNVELFGEYLHPGMTKKELRRIFMQTLGDTLRVDTNGKYFIKCILCRVDTSSSALCHVTPHRGRRGNVPGSNSPTNLGLCCSNCNTKNSDKHLLDYVFAEYERNVSVQYLFLVFLVMKEVNVRQNKIVYKLDRADVNADILSQVPDPLLELMFKYYLNNFLGNHIHDEHMCSLASRQRLRAMLRELVTQRLGRERCIEIEQSVFPMFMVAHGQVRDYLEEMHRAQQEGAL